MKVFVFFIALSLGVSAGEEKPDFRLRAPKLAQMKNPVYTAADIKAEIEFGKGLAARILNRYPLVGDSGLQTYVNALGAGLASQIGRPELEFYFGVVDTLDVNAYACPGGYILLTKGLLNLLENEAELVGVLAHEIAHVNERHVIKKLKLKGDNQDSLSGLGALVGGATASLRLAVQTISEEAMNLLFSEGLSKNEELTSDLFALNALLATGYRLGSYRDLLLKLKASMESQKALVLSKTHPKVADRLQLVNKFEKKKSDPSIKKINQERFKLYVSR